jgi:hypothetical protein
MNTNNKKVQQELHKKTNHTSITSATNEIVPKSEKKSWKEAKSISLTHKYDRELSWLGTGTSIKRDGVKLVLWTQICPISEMMNNTPLLFIMAC